MGQKKLLTLRLRREEDPPSMEMPVDSRRAGLQPHEPENSITIALRKSIGGKTDVVVHLHSQ